MDEKQGSEMHDLLATSMHQVLREGRTDVDGDGNVVKLPPTAADWNAIRGFLKDNGISVARSPMETPLNDLVNEIHKQSLKFDGVPVDTSAPAPSATKTSAG